MVIRVGSEFRECLSSVVRMSHFVVAGSSKAQKIPMRYMRNCVIVLARGTALYQKALTIGLPAPADCAGQPILPTSGSIVFDAPSLPDTHNTSK